MNIIGNIFGIPRDVIVSIAQVILGIFIIPLLCVIWYLVFGGETPEFITELISEIDLFKVWFGAISQVTDISEQLVVENYLEILIKAAEKGACHTLIIAVFINLAKHIAEKALIKGIPVVQTILGCFLGCVIVQLIDETNEVKLIMWTGSLIVIESIVIFLLKKNIWITYLRLSLDALVAAMVAAYINANILIMQGNIPNFKFAIGLIGVTFCPLLIVLLIDYFLSILE